MFTLRLNAVCYRCNQLISNCTTLTLKADRFSFLVFTISLPVGEQLASDCRQVPLPCKLLSTMATKAITSFSIQHLVFITNEKNSFITISQFTLVIVIGKHNLSTFTSSTLQKCLKLDKCIIVLSCISVWVDFQDLLLVLNILRLRQVISLGWFRFRLRLSLGQ